ncbi:MAG TPA: phosphoglycerate kinase, partial [Actinomycetota bacterium]|nr:phosphoglycerate kinase [Actinomycetota bacterium]
MHGRAVLVRCDFNVPLEDGRITDDLRIQATIPTIERLLDRGAALVLCSHLGRPKGQVVEAYRLDPVADRIRELLNRDVAKLDEVVGASVTKAVADADPGSVTLLENLRFDRREEPNDPGFADA